MRAFSVEVLIPNDQCASRATGPFCGDQKGAGVTKV
jgi:hypothetical protein